jgi:hypothetical protein
LHLASENPVSKFAFQKCNLHRYSWGHAVINPVETVGVAGELATVGGRERCSDAITPH